jgi:hypothetical protein
MVITPLTSPSNPWRILLILGALLSSSRNISLGKKKPTKQEIAVIKRKVLLGEHEQEEE